MESCKPYPQSPEGYVGFLDVFVHEARDIQNICIYHKQDVYAKLSLTADHESAVSTQTINGGGRNPVFNQSLRLNVKTVDSSLRCEIWMLSRVKNYLEDQLLGFTLVPLSDVVMADDGKLVLHEFSLSSNDLFHSPTGFVQLSISYSGASPEVMAITPSPKGSAVDENEEPVACELEKIEFPDLKVAKENNMMVSEYFGIPCTNSDSVSDNCHDEEAGIRVVESFATASSPDSVAVQRKETPLSSDSMNGSSPDRKDKSAEGNAESFGENSEFVPPVLKIDIDPEPKNSVVQQDIVDMYMKSMQQFTESLANMKLPMDIVNDTTSSGSNSTENGGSGSEKKLQASEKTGPRVFYGSRAFF